MIFHHTKIPGVFLIEPEKVADNRGFFARTWCRHEFSQHGLSTNWAQCGTSFNEKRGTLRGMHFQVAPHEEVKLLRCIRGAIFDVLIDIRPESPTYLRWQGFELSGDNRLQLHVPHGIAHGYISLTDQSEVFYQISTDYVATAAKGLRWNDPAINITWPFEPVVISPRDAEWPLLPKRTPAPLTPAFQHLSAHTPATR